VKKALLIVIILVLAGSAVFFGRLVGINYYRQQAYLAEERGQYTKSIENFDKVMLLSLNSKTAGMYTYRARLYFNNGNIKKALQDLNDALSLEKDNPDAHLGLGLIRLQEGDTEQAIKEFTTVIEKRPKWTEPYMSRQVAYRKLGEKKKAEQDIKRVLEIEPKNEWAKKALKVLNQ
jgi:tetratricopeptide (TPR) repeat protein